MFNEVLVDSMYRGKNVDENILAVPRSENVFVLIVTTLVIFPWKFDNDKLYKRFFVKSTT